MKIDKLKKCRVCGGEIKTLYDFGEVFISGFVKLGVEVEKAPLLVVECITCGLVQLGDTVDLDKLYKDQYWYMSSLNKSMVKSLEDIVIKAMKKIRLQPGDVVVDIGTNDGTLLSFYPDFVYKVGYEPSLNTREMAKNNCNFLVNDYFSANTYPKEFPRAKIITTIAMFYDLPDPNKFVEDIKKIMDEGGIWVIQLTDLFSMVKLNEFTSFCHEHLEYYKLADLLNLMNEHDLVITDLEYNDTNGGSLRVYVEKIVNFNRINDIVGSAFILEAEQLGLSENKWSKKFFEDIEGIADSVMNLFINIKDAGDDIYGLGASTKGSTLCQFFGIGSDLLTAIGEVNPDKYGLVTAGTNIPIISEEELFAKNPKYIFLIIWQFKDNIIKKLQDKIDNGLQVIVPLPYPHIVAKSTSIQGQEIKGDFYF